MRRPSAPPKPQFITARQFCFSLCDRYLHQKISGAKAALPEVAEMNKQVRKSLQNKASNPL
jgi:hypothetical protein